MTLFGKIVFFDETCATLFSYLSNFILLYCVIKNWKPELRNLNVILVQNIALDMILGMFPMLCGMWMAFIEGRVFVIQTGLVRFTDYYTACCVYCLYCGVICVCVMAFPMQFFFRYKTLCGKSSISHCLHGTLWAILLTFGTIIFCGFFFSYSFRNNLATFDPHANEVLKDYVEINEKTAFVVTESAFQTTVLFPATFAFIFVSYVAACFIVFYYATKISRFIRCNAAMTENYKHLYLMLHKTLMLQAVLFLVSGVIPGMTMSLYSVLRVQNSPYFFALGSAGFAWLSVINPCISIYLIQPYRRFLRTKIRKRFGISFVETSVKHSKVHIIASKSTITRITGNVSYTK